MADILPALYQRYKRGTKAICQFLAERANECGKLTGMPGPTPKNATAAKKQKRVQRGDMTVKLSVKHLKRLATGIRAASKPNTSPPAHLQEIIAMTQDVIFCRQEYGIWYRQQGKLKNDGDHHGTGRDGHQYFVDALKFILASLREAYDSNAPHQAVPKTSEDSTLVTASTRLCANQFATLALEDDDWMNESDEVHDGTESKAKDKPAVGNFELVQDRSDDAFGLWCFLKDCHTLRMSLLGHWRDYQKGALSFFVVSRLTEAAFLQFHLAAVEFRSEFPHLSTFDNIAEFLEIKLSRLDNKMSSFSCNDAELNKDEQDSSAAADLLCLPAVVVLNLQRCYAGLPRGSADFDNTADNIADHINRHHNLAAILQNMGCEFGLLHRQPDRCKDLAGLDHFTSMYLRFQKDLIITLDLTICFQTYMDVYYIILDAHMIHHYQCLYGLLRHIEGAAGPNFNNKAVFEDHWTYDGGQESRNRQDKIQQLVDEGIEKPMRDADLDALLDLLDPTRLQPSSEDRNKLVKLLPLLSAHMASTILTLQYADGVHACNRSCAVLAVAHLYSVCRDTGLIDTPWIDMEFVIKCFGPRNLGLRANGASEVIKQPFLAAAKNFGLAMGVPAQSYALANKKRSPGEGPIRVWTSLHIAKRRAPELRPQSVYYGALNESQKMNDNLGFTKLSADIDALQRMTRRYLDGDNPSVDASIRAQWTSTRQLRPDQVLTVIRNLLTEEEVELNFGFHRFAVECATILSEWTRDLDVAVNAPESATSRPDLRFCEVVDHVLWEAASREAVHEEERALLDLENPTLIHNFADILKRLDKTVSSDFHTELARTLASQDVTKAPRTEGSNGSFRDLFDPPNGREGLMLFLEGSRIGIANPPGPPQDPLIARFREAIGRVVWRIWQRPFREDLADIAAELKQLKVVYDEECARLYDEEHARLNASTGSQDDPVVDGE